MNQHCDWISFTVQFYKTISWPIFISQEWKQIPPIAHFANGQENKQGIRLYWSQSRPQQGKHVILSGSVLDMMQGKILDLLNWIMSQEYKVTRIDFAINVLNSNINPRNSSYHLERGQCKTRAKKATTWDDRLCDGFTQYIGRKSSPVFVRIYDKGAEMGTIFKWVRIEIVYGAFKAQKALETYLQMGDCRGMVRAYCDFPKWRKWNAIFNVPLSPVVVSRKITKTRTWLLGQVAKSLAKEMTLDDDNEFYLNFIQRVREEYLSLIDNGTELTF